MSPATITPLSYLVNIKPLRHLEKKYLNGQDSSTGGGWTERSGVWILLDLDRAADLNRGDHFSVLQIIAVLILFRFDYFEIFAE